jgi:hypothetical protein
VVGDRKTSSCGTGATATLHLLGHLAAGAHDPRCSGVGWVGGGEVVRRGASRATAAELGLVPG